MGTFTSAAETTGANAARNTAIDAVAALVNGGSLRIYSGTAPADADASLGGATLLAELPLGNPAFGSALAGVATANTITADSSADATGTPSFFRLLASNGTTVVYQGTAGASGQELNLSDLSSGQIVSGGSVSVSSLTITQAASYS
ncbi:MAG: hypothetical protein AAFQ55_18290 [Pseudomonadota bacterium]